MPDKSPNDVLTNFTESELSILEKVAQQMGVSLEEAATHLVEAGIANRVKRKTGSTPAKIYSIGQKR